MSETFDFSRREDEKYVLGFIKGPTYQRNFLHEAGAGLRRNPEFILKAMSVDPIIALECSLVPNMHENEKIVNTALDLDGNSLKFFPQLKNRKFVVLRALRQNGLSLRYASESLRDEKDVVLFACQGNGKALINASRRLRCDKTVIIDSILKSHIAFLYADEKLKNDRDFVLLCARINGRILEFSSKFVNDKEIVLAAIDHNPGSFRYCGKMMRRSREMSLEAISRDGNVLAYCKKKFRGDLEFVKIAVQKSPEAIKFATDEVKKEILGDDYEEIIEKMRRSSKIIVEEEEEGEGEGVKKKNFLQVNIL